MGKIEDGWRTTEANTLARMGYPMGRDVEPPRKVEGGPLVDRHAEQQKRARAEARARLLEANGGKLPRTLPGACWPPGHPLAPKPKPKETVSTAESPAGEPKVEP